MNCSEKSTAKGIEMQKLTLFESVEQTINNQFVHGKTSCKVFFFSFNIK